MSRAGRLAAVLVVMDVAHDFADHVVQTDRQALGKAAPDARTWVPAMAGHVGGYHLVQVAALVAADRYLGLRLRPSRVAAAVALSASTHALLDRRWPVRRIMEKTGSPGFAAAVTRVHVPVDGLGHVVNEPGVPTEVEVTGPVALSGMYHVDQAMHRIVLLLAATVATSGRKTE